MKPKTEQTDKMKASENNYWYFWPLGMFEIVLSIKKSTNNVTFSHDRICQLNRANKNHYSLPYKVPQIF